MKIGLMDVDGHNFPNLALMKISAFHRRKNDSVEWFNSLSNYDIVYKSKVFTFTPDENFVINSSQVISGGTGYDITKILPQEIDVVCPNYSLYPNFKSALGFVTRGCPNKCGWCVVPKKEGDIKPYADIESFLDGRNSAILMDNNILASNYGLKQIEKIIDLKIKVDFNQGLDSRIIANNEDIAKLLSKVKWLKPLRMACDTKLQMQSVEKATLLLRKYKTTPSNYFVYVLVKDIPDALERVEFLKNLKLDSFAQPFRDYENRAVNPELIKFARWVNHKAIFKTVEWKDYNQSRKNHDRNKKREGK